MRSPTPLKCNRKTNHCGDSAKVTNSDGDTDCVVDDNKKASNDDAGARPINDTTTATATPDIVAGKPDDDGDGDGDRSDEEAAVTIGSTMIPTDAEATTSIVVAQLVVDEDFNSSNNDGDDEEDQRRSLKIVEAQVVPYDAQNRYLYCLALVVVSVVVIGIGVGVGTGLRIDENSQTSYTESVQSFVPSRSLSPTSQPTQMPSTEFEMDLAILTDFLGFEPKSDIQTLTLGEFESESIFLNFATRYMLDRSDCLFSSLSEVY